MESTGRAVRSGLKQPGVIAWLRLARVYSRMEHTAHDHLRCAGLSVAQFDVLAQVGAREGCTQQELANALLVTKGNVTQLLDRMEEAGLLTRRQEGRAKRVGLTEAGRRLRDRVLPEHEAVMAGLFGSLTDEEQHQLLALLRTLDKGLDDHATQE